MVVELQEGHTESNEDKEKAPDFLATHVGTDYSFYVEATVRTNKRAQKKNEFRESLKVALNQIESPEYVISIDDLMITSNHWTPSTDRFVRHVRNKLSDLKIQSHSKLMSPDPFEGKGWQVFFHFELRSEQNGWVKPSQTVKETPSMSADHSLHNIWKAIKKKGSYYGKLEYPFIIAINVMEYLVDPETVFEALYGSINHIYSSAENEISPFGNLEFSHYEREPNGAFLARGRQNQRVSAVWIANGLKRPSQIGSAELYEFENHYALRKFAPQFPCLKKYYINQDGKLDVQSGLTAQQILKIENCWLHDNS